MTRRRVLVCVGYAAAGLLGVIAALATAGCGSGSGGGLSNAITKTLPGHTLTTPETTSPIEGGSEATITFETTTQAPARPPGTVTETLPAVTETLPSRTVTVTETLPVATETLPATTQTLPAVTVTTTSVNTVAAVAAGAAVASSQPEAESSTQWGWIAFGILAVAVVIGGIVWWLRRRSARKPDEPAPPAAQA